MSQNPIITPTVGRVVWYYPQSTDPAPRTHPPLAALIAFVHSDTLVNLAVFDMSGIPSGKWNVPLVQDDGAGRTGEFCRWMPYQKGQAAKTEELARKAAQ